MNGLAPTGSPASPDSYPSEYLGFDQNRFRRRGAAALLMTHIRDTFPNGLALFDFHTAPYPPRLSGLALLQRIANSRAIAP